MTDDTTRASPRPAGHVPGRVSPALLAILLLISTGCAANGPTHRHGGSLRLSVAQPARGVVHEFADVVACDVAASAGSLHLLLGKRTGAGTKDFTLAYTRSNDRGATWSLPVPIPTGHAPAAKMHRGDDPRIAAIGDRLMALWTARGDGPFGSGPLATALSDDGGRTWRPGPAPSAQPLTAGAIPPRTAAATDPAPSTPGKAREATGPGYRFPAAAAAAAGFHVVWIHAAGDERSLRHAALPFDEARWSDPVVVDPHLCACCWNELHVQADGSLLTLYRDQRPSDMSLARSSDGGRTWLGAGRAGEFDWDFDGCPHVGGAVATVTGPRGDDDSLLATVWTGNAGSTGAYVLRGTRRGTWSAPTPLGDGDARGRNTDVAAIPGTGTAAVVWDQPSPAGGQCVCVRVTPDAGQSWGPPLRLSVEGENASYPRVVSVNGSFVALWTRYSQDGTTTLRVSGLPAK